MQSIHSTSIQSPIKYKRKDIYNIYHVNLLILMLRLILLHNLIRLSILLLTLL